MTGFFGKLFGGRSKSNEDSSLPGIDSLGDVRGKRVFLRASLNVPVKDGAVESAFRLQSALATLRLLKSRGARIILAGHMGRDGVESMMPVFEALSKELPILPPISLADAAEVNARVEALKDGDVLMLENLRMHEGEAANDPAFAARLAALADFYVNDAFSDSHREHASIVGIPKLLPSCFGLAFLRECEELAKAMSPSSPSLLILGGAKFETKLPLIEKYMRIYDHVFIGGALANDFFKAKGLETGISLVSESALPLDALLQSERLLLPVDVTVRSREGIRETVPSDVHGDESILDAGPETIALLVPHIQKAKTILWNGPLGNYEEGFSKYTEALATAVAESGAHSILGGGDTIATIEALRAEGKFGFLSTAGGAMLVFLESGTLPGIEAVTGSR